MTDKINNYLEVVYDEDKSPTNITGKIISVGDESFELESGNKILSLDYNQVKSALVKISFK